MLALVRLLPWGLVWLRVALGPLLGWLIWVEVGTGWLITLFVLAFLSDYYDGVIARNIGVATANLRRADSIADTVFYCCLAIGLFWRYPAFWLEHWVGLSSLIALELIRFGVEFKKFGKMAAYHMWSAKAWGISLLLGILEVFITKQTGLFFQIAIILGIITDCEGLIASFVLPTWHHDVPSLWHALALRKADNA